MAHGAFEPYAPLDRLKPVAEDVWIVDGPEIGMRLAGITLPFPTRMTVIRLPSGSVWIHSPIAWNDELGAAVAALGPVRHLVAPNTLHYWYLPEWMAHFPDARSYGVSGLMKKARRPLTIHETLGDDPPPSWEGVFEQCILTGRSFTEADFLHRPSRTLIVTDLIENFEPARIRSRVLRWVVELSGAADPDGKAPIDMQWSFIGSRGRIRTSVGRMIDWRPERIILAHGRWYDTAATNELRRAFRWL